MQMQSSDAKQQLRLMMQYASKLAPLPEEAHNWNNRVMGCTTQVCFVQTF